MVIKWDSLMRFFASGSLIKVISQISFNAFYFMTLNSPGNTVSTF